MEHNITIIEDYDYDAVYHNITKEEDCDIDTDDHNISTIEDCDNDVGDHNISTIEDCDNDTRADKQNWNVFGYSIPKQEVVFFCQIIALYIVIFICLINISIGNGESHLWFSLLAGSIGYLLPNPTLKKETIILQGPLPNSI